MAMPLLSLMSTIQQDPLKGCARTTFCGKCFADQEVMKAANTSYGCRRQMLAARRQKKNSSSKWPDTFHYNGPTTGGDALRAGLPIVSLCGGSIASPSTGSLLQQGNAIESLTKGH